MKKILFFLMFMITLVSCNNDANMLNEEEIVQTNLVVESKFESEVAANKDYYTVSPIGLTNFVELTNCYYTGNEDTNYLIDWSENTFINLSNEDTVHFKFKNNEQIRGIEITNYRKNAVKKLQLTFSDGTIKIIELKDVTSNQSFQFDKTIYSNSLSIKSLDKNISKVSEIHLVADVVMNKLDFEEYCDKSEKVYKLQNKYNWTKDISTNYKIVNEIKEEFTTDELLELSEEIDPNVINQNLDKYIGFPLLIKGKILNFKKNDLGYNLTLKSLLNQKEYTIIFNEEVEENLLMSISGIIIGEDELNRVVIYGIK